MLDFESKFGGNSWRIDGDSIVVVASLTGLNGV